MELPGQPATWPHVCKHLPQRLLIAKVAMRQREHMQVCWHACPSRSAYMQSSLASLLQRAVSET